MKLPNKTKESNQKDPKKGSQRGSWEKASDWYDKAVGSDGHYYHTHVVIPGVLKHLKEGSPAPSSLLDLACGQGILLRHLPSHFTYTGLDISPSLIRAAQAYKTKHVAHFAVADITTPLPLQKKDFTHATLILAVQNIADPLKAFKHAGVHLKKGGKLIIVMNHPCYRIPRQTAWEVDKNKKIQYRRVDRYLSSLEIPIHTHPGKESSTQTVSFHHPLSAYSAWLKDAGFAIELIEEWCSDKTSTGGAAAMENRARQEFPLFLTIVAIRL